MSAPATTRTRPTWPELPAAVRAAIERRIGAVTGWTSHDGGYSPGMASTLRAPGGAVFVKAVSAVHEFSAHLYREEARRAALLPPGVPAPRFLWSAEIEAPDARDREWVTIAFETTPSRSPRIPWHDDELGAVLDLAVAVGEHTVSGDVFPSFSRELPTGAALLAAERPSGLATYDPWLPDHLDRIAELELEAPAAVEGAHLVHADMRGDNALLVGHGAEVRALAVDWPYAARGAAFCDLVGMLPATHVEGGPPPEEALRRRPLPPGTDEDAVTAFLASMTGYFVHSSLLAPPPAIPHLRAFQRAQGEVCIAWLRRRLGG